MGEEADYYEEYANNELEKYNDHLNHMNNDLVDAKRHWRESKEIMGKQVLARAAEGRAKVLLGFFAHTSENELVHGTVRARTADEVRYYLGSKGLHPIAVAPLRKGESIENMTPSMFQLRERYEKVLASADKNRSLSEAEKFAVQYLADKMRELDEKRAAAKELEGVDPAKGYISAVRPQALKLIAKRNRPNQFTLPLIGIRTGTLAFIGLCGDLIANTAFGVPEVGLGAAALGAGSIIVHALIRSNIKEMKPLTNKVIESNFDLERASLRLWLHTRYGISVSRDVLATLGEAVHGTENQVDFEAEDGRYFKFMKVMDAEGWFVFETAPPAAQSIGQIQAALTRASGALDRAQAVLEPKAAQPLFTGEAALLHERIQQMLGLLDQQPLNVEEQHVVNRARQDVDATASTLANLAALGDRESGQTRVASVLGQLIEELNELVNDKKAALLTELDVQRAYVVERRRPLGGRLELSKPQAQLESAPEQETTK